VLRAALRSLLQHKLRLLLTLLAVVVGVAFVAGTFIFTDSLKRSFDALFTSPLPDITVSRQRLGQPGGARPRRRLPTPRRRRRPVASPVRVAAAYGVVPMARSSSAPTARSSASPAPPRAARPGSRPTISAQLQRRGPAGPTGAPCRPDAGRVPWATRSGSHPRRHVA
jgi:hypothetical protein